MLTLSYLCLHCLIFVYIVLSLFTLSNLCLHCHVFPVLCLFTMFYPCLHCLFFVYIVLSLFTLSYLCLHCLIFSQCLIFVYIQSIKIYIAPLQDTYSEARYLLIVMSFQWFMSVYNVLSLLTLPFLCLHCLFFVCIVLSLLSLPFLCLHCLQLHCLIFAADDYRLGSYNYDNDTQTTNIYLGNINPKVMVNHVQWQR